MALQTRDLAMTGLSVLGDVPPHALQPRLADGIHLRWAFERGRGFPWFGYHLFRRPILGGDRKRTPVDFGVLGGASPGDTVTLPGAVISSDGALTTTEDFAPSGRPEIDLATQPELRIVPDELASEIEVEIGFRQDGEVALTALLEQVPVAMRSVRGQAGQVVRERIGFDAISELLLGRATAALAELRFVAVTAGATSGWQPVPKATYPLPLPVAHPDYPVAAANAQAAHALATSRIRYGPASPWTPARFAVLHDTLRQVVAGGPTGPPMADKSSAVAPAPADPNLTMPAQSPLDLLLLAALHPAAAQILALAWVDEAVAAGERWDYLIVADHTGVLGSDPATALAHLRTSGFSGVDGFIVFDKSIDDPAPPLVAPQWARAYAVPGRQVPSAALRWDRARAATGALLPAGPVMHHLWRVDHGNAQPATPSATAGSAITRDAPVLAAEPVPGAPLPPAAPSGWPPFRILYADSGLAEGWYGYAVSGVDLFGRHSVPGAPASWHAPTAAEPVLHPFAIGLLDKTPPPAPAAVEAQALDPGDPTVIQDAAYTAWRQALPAIVHDVVGLRVRWLWTEDHMQQAPDTREFRVYLQPGRINARVGRVVAVNPGPAADRSLVDTDIANTQPANAWAGTRLLIGNDAFTVLSSEAGTPLRLDVRNIGPDRTVRPASGPCGLAIPDGHVLARDFGAAAAWAERRYVVAASDTARYTERTVGGKRERRYEVFLPDPSAAQHPGLPLTPDRAEPIAFGHVGVSAADDKRHVTDDPRWAAGSWGGPDRFGNEGRVGGPAAIFVVHRVPPDPPAIPPYPGGRLWATPADYHGRSYFTYRWIPEEHLEVHVLRAMDDSLFQVDWAGRPGWAALDPAGDPDHRALFPREPRWDAATLQAVAGELNALRTLKTTSGTTTAAAMAAYAALSDDALRVLAGLPGSERAFAQLTITPLDPEDLATADRRGPDSPAGYVADPALRAYVDELDGRGANRWFYRCLAVDPAQNRSRLSLATPPVWLPKVTPPRAPRITKISGGDKQITLRWASNREPDLASYRVYRTEDAAAARDVRTMELVQTVAVGPGDPEARPAAVSFTDAPVPGLRNLTYRVTATDAAGNESEPSQAVAGRAYDQTPPDPPAWERGEWLRIDALGTEHPWAAGPPAGESWQPAVALRWSTPERGRVLLQRRAAGSGSWSSVTGWLEPDAFSEADGAWRTATYDAPAEPGTAVTYRLKVQSAAGNLNVAYDELEVGGA